MFIGGTTLHSTWCFSGFWHEILPAFLLPSDDGARHLPPLHFKDLVDCVSFSPVAIFPKNYLCCVFKKKKKIVLAKPAHLNMKMEVELLLAVVTLVLVDGSLLLPTDLS
jgi:hypothetical protein